MIDLAMPVLLYTAVERKLSLCVWRGVGDSNKKEDQKLF